MPSCSPQGLVVLSQSVCQAKSIMHTFLPPEGDRTGHEACATEVGLRAQGELSIWTHKGSVRIYIENKPYWNF